MASTQTRTFKNLIGGEHREHEPEEQAGVAHDPQRGLEPVLERGRRRERPGRDEAHRRREHEAGVLSVD